MDSESRENRNAASSLPVRVLMWAVLISVCVLIVWQLGVRNIPVLPVDGCITTDLVSLDGTVEHYDSNNFRLPKKGERLIFTLTIPDGADEIDNPMLCFCNYNSVVTITSGGNVLYAHGQVKQDKGWPTGHTIIRVPVRAGSVVTIEYLQQEDNTLSSLSEIVLMPAQYSWLYPVRTLPLQISLTLFVIFAVFSLLIFVFNTVFSLGRQELAQGFMLSLFCITMTLWALGYSGTLFVLTNNDTTIPFAEYTATYLIPVFFCGYMLYGAASYGWRKKVSAVLEAFFFVIFLAATLVQLFGPEHNGYLTFLGICYTILLFSCIFFTVLVFRDRTSAGRVFRIGMVITILLALSDVIAAMMIRIREIDDGSGSRFAAQAITPAIVLVFQTTLMADYLSRVYRAYQKRKELERLEQVAYTDALTGLDSRAAFEDRELPVLEKQPCYAIAFIDADGLKRTNDRCGHREGDHLLKTVSDAIRSGCAGSGCLGFRYGGDEFLIAGKDKATVQGAVDAMEKILSRKNLSDGTPITVSSGIAVHLKASDRSASDIIREADSRMYQQKKEKHKTREESCP